ncbi:glycosyltransferase family 2 protein [Dyadobacter frigoris]|uniref:Glycosyltransferase family 2 protein n=1 Tax=Dyadobacter frigoris TaxID=2576211 RepID=A0A4U6D2R6_9BACT|nr:glycosyltransferase family 2 protein [Dyadobacter frigoris]TKT90615.1 glycosyltransferase family 2 protein [Dyadobacter frigoris]GLU51236.1 beta 1,4 glucosyltransferase [Dyadobacter frigoris]
MIPVSIVIITKNEALLIGECLKSAALITDDIVVIDSGSTDGTLEIARQYGCRIYQENWEGYGANKNKGVALAHYDWILSIDGDEIADRRLIRSLHNLDFDDPRIVYDIKFRSYFGKKPIRFGEWGRNHHVRLFNRSQIKWAKAKVHETLLLPKGTIRKKTEGRLHHFSVQNIFECHNKAIYYARLSAAQYAKNGNKASFLKLYLSPSFVFVKNYILRLGFLDGWEGLVIAKMMFKNTRLKYYYLKQYEQGKFVRDENLPHHQHLFLNIDPFEK